MNVTLTCSIVASNDEVRSAFGPRVTSVCTIARIARSEGRVHAVVLEPKSNKRIKQAVRDAAKADLGGCRTASLWCPPP